MPGPSGIITRGREDILPTGRNFYTLDPRRLPTRAAWRVGQNLARALIAKHLEEEGRYPENVAMFWMCNDMMWADGEGMGQLLYLLGVVPRWLGNGMVEGFDVIPLEELDRPRIDVTVRVSGLLRDSFPAAMHMLDAAEMGVNTVEREGVSWSHPSRFVLVGTMNPEEGELRPQLLDRFGLCVEVRGMAEPEARLQVMKRRAAFEDDPVGFRAAWQERENEIAERIVAARRKLGSVAVPEDVMRAIVELAIETEVDGHRADIVMLKTVKAIAAWRGDGKAAREDVMQAARLVLPHRMRRKPFQNVGSAKAVR